MFKECYGGFQAVPSDFRGFQGVLLLIQRVPELFQWILGVFQGFSKPKVAERSRTFPVLGFGILGAFREFQGVSGRSRGDFRRV